MVGAAPAAPAPSTHACITMEQARAGARADDDDGGIRRRADLRQ